MGHTDTETYEDSPEEIKQRSAKETEILTGNLGDAIIPAHEILADPAQLRILALLQESMVSFSPLQLLGFAQDPIKLGFFYFEDDLRLLEIHWDR